MRPRVSARPFLRRRGGLRRPGARAADRFDLLAQMSAPDETEIRASIEERWTRSKESGLSLAAEFSDAFGAAGAVVDGLWDTDDFRASELERYDELLSGAVTMVLRDAETRLLDALVAACVSFAAEHPEAPRG